MQNGANRCRQAAAEQRAAPRQRSAAEEESARARLAAIEARSGAAKAQPKKRPPAAAAAARTDAPVARAPSGGSSGSAVVDLPARYIPADGAAAMDDGVPRSLSTGVQAPSVAPTPQLSAPVGMSAEEEEQAALEAAIQLSLSAPSGPTGSAPAPAPGVDTSALRPFIPGSPPTVEMEGLYEQLQLLLQQGAKGAVALKTLATICGNVVKNPTESKFRSLKLSNPNIQERLASVPGALGCLDAIGFRLDGKDRSIDGTAFAVLPMDSPAEGVAQSLELAINPALEVVARQGQGGGAAIDRALTVYIPSETGPDPSRFNVPPEFFELSGGEAMQMVSSSQAKREADSVLRTKAMRESEQRGKKRNYRRCIVRVRFPDQTVMQVRYTDSFARHFPLQSLISP